MKFLVVGLGSMGKRRVRCLKALGCNDITGFDLRKDRRDEAAKLYGITTIQDINHFLKSHPVDAFIISVPPDLHMHYMQLALRNNIHFFVEASVVDNGMRKLIQQLKKKHLVAQASSTLCFHPAVQLISKLIKMRSFGKVSNFIYHSGQYLPDWHKYEKVSDYYVSNPSTGAAREIVPFELTWITKLLGWPASAIGIHGKTIKIPGAEKIDDTYNFILDYKSMFVSVTVDVVSRYATRRLLINGEKMQLRWSWEDDFIELYAPKKSSWSRMHFQKGSAAKGYNKNITEEMYINELKSFIDAILGKRTVANTIQEDFSVLQLLYKIENSYKR